MESVKAKTSLNSASKIEVLLLIGAHSYADHFTGNSHARLQSLERVFLVKSKKNKSIGEKMTRKKEGRGPINKKKQTLRHHHPHPHHYHHHHHHRHTTTTTVTVDASGRAQSDAGSVTAGVRIHFTKKKVFTAIITVSLFLHTTIMKD